ncbi:alpha/beta hydrolase [Amycolatopsis jiangsuensis]|uniref:Pimeloyl-ACP methyl ester carboxylesterase n=1 Tax=Amycolatopsis jiangsuensis TaxID=1181879 RepID=A0A840IN44_9PSEU|nr:alpha/beta fold hydrolase [Amycolatopsis jiangsuensis]MBB4683831.1 pimeloyl-ACP methyl ester carboxylesterase [Amycolatopsis jiangsuensis]
MTTKQLELPVHGRTITGLTTTGDAPGSPLVVALHGGGYNSGYFHVAGHSLLDLAETAGFRVFSLDRPGYGGSDTLPDDEATFGASAGLLDAAVGALWTEHGAGRPGVVLLSHSIGSAIAVHIAARRPRWPLLGISLHGVGDQSPEHVVNAWHAMPTSGPVELPSEQRRALLYGPESTVDADAVEAAKASVEPVSIGEMLEIVEGWPANLAKLAAEVAVPVQYTLAEHDGLWNVSESRVAAFAGYFTAAPWVETRLQPSAGHNLDHHRLSLALHLRQLAFVSECATRAS